VKDLGISIVGHRRSLAQDAHTELAGRPHLEPSPSHEH
jgi:hypothetical protein